MRNLSRNTAILIALACALSIWGGGVYAFVNTFSDDVQLDDGTGDSPSLVFIDATDETTTITKLDGAYTTVTTEALDGINILGGSMKIGNGTPTQALDGEDLYVEGNIEWDGTAFGVYATPIAVSEDGANAEFRASAYSDTEAITAILTTRKGDNTEAAPALVDDNAVLGTWSMQGYDGSGFEEGARIEARVDGTPSDGTDMPTELTFWTTPDASATSVQRVRINPAGQVGVGIDPQRRFDVLGELRVTRAGGAGGDAFYELIAGTAGVSRARFGDTDDPNVGAITYDHATNMFTFVTAISDAMTLDSSQNLAVVGSITGTAGSLVSGVNSTTQGTQFSWDGGSNEPGTQGNASGDGSLWYRWIDNSGCLRVSATEPTVDSNGTNLACPSSFSGLTHTEGTANAWTIAVDADIWNKLDFNVTNAVVTHETGAAVASKANSWIEIGAGGTGKYTTTLTAGIQGGGVNKDAWLGIAVTRVAPIDIASITNANPPVVTTSSAHGFHEGASEGVLGGIIVGTTGAGSGAINTSHFFTVLSPTTFSLQDFGGTDLGAPGAIDASTGDITVEVHGETMMPFRPSSTSDRIPVACGGKIDLVVGDLVYGVIGGETDGTDVSGLSVTFEIERIDNGS